MFYLKECDFEDCTRSGYVALENGDKVCNIHKFKTVEVKVKIKKQDENEDEE